jgi:RNA polymerase sigma-70 factor (ECF subfamily)
MNTPVLQFIQGDPEAFSKIYALLAPRLKAMAYRYCRNTENASDIVQDVFTKLAAMDSRTRMEHFGSSEANLEGWLMVSVKHRAMDIVKIEESRRKKRTQVRSTFADQTQNGSEETTTQQRFHLMCKFLQPRQREVIELHIEGYRNDEIADRLNLSYNTVKNNIYEARQKLKNIWLRFME